MTAVKPFYTAEKRENPAAVESASQLYEKFKRTGSVQGNKKAKATATASVATDEAKERGDDFLHTYTIARSNDHAHQVWSQLLAASAIY
ncbi:hypothetical protein AVEN_252280-1 [Araneus ventricosus]|uniref:DUF4817 domain-containing protein n=1 Tax=Araneus ventricosus TaxID=182803 RepID=A0A4Y2DSB3_ARAVE|nr:hypothetical protein AVEN_252280-1 [Araneus ventricosus]